MEEDRTIFQKAEFADRLIEALPLPIFYKDALGIYRGCNERFASYLKRDKDKIIGKSVFDVAPPSLADIYKTQDDELLDPRKPSEQIYEAAVDTDGERKKVQFYKGRIFDSKGSTIGLVGTIVDITSQTIEHQKLSEALERHKTLMSASSEGIIIHQDFKVIDANDRAAALIGGSVESLIGRNVATFFVEQSRQLVQQKIQTSDEEEYEAIMLHSSGATFGCRIQGRQIHHDGKNARVAIFHKVSDEKFVYQKTDDQIGMAAGWRELLAVGAILMTMSGLIGATFFALKELGFAGTRDSLVAAILFSFSIAVALSCLVLWISHQIQLIRMPGDGANRIWTALIVTILTAVASGAATIFTNN